jgi:hypothetical protein
LGASIDLNTGNASEAMPWMPAACSGLPPHFPIPACRMYAPVRTRVGTVRIFIVNLLPGWYAKNSFVFNHCFQLIQRGWAQLCAHPPLSTAGRQIVPMRR